MGCAGSKPETRTEPGPGSEGGDAMEVGGSEKVRTFRERRLSMSQMQDANARPRRLSIYGTALGDDAQPSLAHVEPHKHLALQFAAGTKPTLHVPNATFL